ELEWDILIEQMDLLYASETEYGLLKGIVVRNPADEFWNLDNFWTWDPDQWDDYDNNIPDHLKDIPENDRRDDE
ncbi:MAG: hypothetical protein VX768_00030, partial [Planctomycetota bacterium]|nr:hypothetical protein [Planctomycetota bacterium]